MSTLKPATAGDVELAKSRLVAGAVPSAENGLAGASSGVGPTSTLGSRLNSLWSEMFHDAAHEMVRSRTKDDSRETAVEFIALDEACCHRFYLSKRKLPHRQMN